MSGDAKLEYLVARVGDGPVVPFLGAGVNVGLVPLWRDLLGRMLEYGLALGTTYDPAACKTAHEALMGSSTLFTTYDLANLVKRLLRRRYLHVLRQVIYERYNGDEAQFRQNSFAELPFLRATAELCRSKRVTAVVSYNYDDILLRALWEDRRAYPVSGPSPAPHQGDGLPIFFIHGYLPNVGHPPQPKTVQVVLSLDEYFHNMGEPHSWQTTTQLHFLRNANCLFLGASLNDINALRMLSYSKRYSSGGSVFALMAEQDFDSLVLPDGEPGCRQMAREIAIRSKASLLAEVGVELLVVPTYDVLYELVSALAKKLDGKGES